MACSAVTRLQYASALRTAHTTHANAAVWAASELRRRAASVATALDSFLKPTDWGDVRSSCARFGAPDTGGCASALWESVNGRLDLLRAESRTSASSDDLVNFFWEKESFLDALQYNVTGIRTLASNANGQHELRVARFSAVSAFLSALTDVSALTRDKYGVVPPTVLSGCGLDSADAASLAEAVQADGNVAELSSSSSTLPGAATAAGGLRSALPVLGVRPFVEYACAELLKNAFKATVDRFGAAGVDDAPPVHVRLSCASSFACISIADAGGGVPASLARRQLALERHWHAQGGGRHGAGGASAGDGDSSYVAGTFAGAISVFPYFSSTTQSIAPPTYTYSRDFGPAYSGKGLGLVRSRLYAQYHGGSLTLLSQPGLGTTALLALERSGTAGGDFVEWPLR